MSENSKDVLKSLLSKLSAVRVTLTDDEQFLLDQLLLSSREEVQAHYRAYVPDEAKAFGADDARAMAKAVAPDEAKVMGADEARAMAKQFKPEEARALGAEEAFAHRLLIPVEARALEADEVTAHSLPASMVTKPGFPNPVWVKIIYDPMMECYKVI